MVNRYRDVLAANALAQALSPLMRPGVNRLSLTTLITGLTHTSDHFRTLWARHDVLAVTAAIRYDE